MPQTRIDWREVARWMLTSRAVDQLEETELVPGGKVTYQFSARGHELAQVLLALSLDHPHDAAGVYYRSRPFLFASGLNVREALSGSMAKAGSLTGGRDIGVVHMLERRGRALVLPAAGDVGSQYTPAVGWAQAIRYYQRVLHDDDWAGSIVVACGGDGSTAANGFWAALNIVTTQQVAVSVLHRRQRLRHQRAERVSNARRRSRQKSRVVRQSLRVGWRWHGSDRCFKQDRSSHSPCARTSRPGAAPIECAAPQRPFVRR